MNTRPNTYSTTMDGRSSSKSPIKSPSHSGNHNHEGHRKFEDMFRHLIKWGHHKGQKDRLEDSRSPNGSNLTISDQLSREGTPTPPPAPSSYYAAYNNNYEDYCGDPCEGEGDSNTRGRSRSRSLDVPTVRRPRRRRLSGDVICSDRYSDYGQTHQTYTIYESIIMDGQRNRAQQAQMSSSNPEKESIPAPRSHSGFCLLFASVIVIDSIVDCGLGGWFGERKKCDFRLHIVMEF